MHIGPASVAHAEAVGEIFGEAFADDPVWALYFPKAHNRRENIAAHYRREVDRHPDRVDVATDDDGAVLGALLWESPSSKDGGWRRTWDQLRGVASTLNSRWRGQADPGSAHDRAVEALRPSERHWYLHDVATSVRARGRGVGTQLLEHRLGLVDREDPAPMFLESTTPASRRLYARLGFEVVAELDTAPGATAMIRPARGASPAR